MYACTETDVRESANDCILASGEGHGRGETLHPICAARSVSSSSERSVYTMQQVSSNVQHTKTKARKWEKRVTTLPAYNIPKMPRT
jgi:hypothetical protein